MNIAVEINRLSKSINERQARISAMPMADCINCGSSSHVAAFTDICLGCNMGAWDLFKWMAGR